jgi:hypothetical protein
MHPEGANRMNLCGWMCDRYPKSAAEAAMTMEEMEAEIERQQRQREDQKLHWVG